jgi:Uncharacterized conserved protein (DUF2163)/Phage conserved hypothetical protein BR0599
VRNFPGPLISLLNAGPTQLLLANLYTFTLVNGTVLRFTDFDDDITISGVTWQNAPPIVERENIKWTVGTEVDTLDIDISDDGSTLVDGIPLLQAFQLRYFDNATVQLDRAFMVPGGSWIATTNGTFFTGQVGPIEGLGRSTMKLTVRSMLQLLTTSLPINLIQPGCRWTLFSPGCTLLRSAFAVSGIIASGSNKGTLQSNLTNPGPTPGPVAAPTLSSVSGNFIPAQTYYAVVTYINALGETAPSPEAHLTLTLNHRIVVDSPPSVAGVIGWNCYISLAPGDEMLQNPTPIAIGTNFTMPDFQTGPNEGLNPPTQNQTGYFDQGYIQFLTGPNAGATASVDQYLGAGTIVLRRPLNFAPTTGDTFTIYPGCDKSLTTCTFKFNNLINFGGFSFVPSPETAV